MTSSPIPSPFNDRLRLPCRSTVAAAAAVGREAAVKMGNLDVSQNKQWYASFHFQMAWKGNALRREITGTSGLLCGVVCTVTGSAYLYLTVEIESKSSDTVRINGN